MPDSKEDIESLARELREKDEELMIKMGLKPPSNRVDDDKYPANNSSSINIQNAPSKKKRKIVSGQSAGSGQNDIESLESQRQKFFDNFICSINTGSDVVINETIRASCAPNLVYREQYVHFVPDTLIYRELSTAKLLADYMYKLTVAVPDGVIILLSQKLKTRRDGSAYMMARIRFRGSYTYRLITTNWSTDVRQFLRHSKTLKPAAALPTSSVMAQKSAFQSASNPDISKSNSASPQDDSSEKQTSHNDNGEEVELSRNKSNDDGGFLMISPTLRNHPWMNISLNHPESHSSETICQEEDEEENADSILDEDQLFQDLYSALVGNEDDVDPLSSNHSNDAVDSHDNAFPNEAVNSTGISMIRDLPVNLPLSTASSATSTNPNPIPSFPKSNNVHSMEIFRASCDHLPNNEPLFMQSPLTHQPQPVVYTAIEREYNYRRKRPVQVSAPGSADPLNSSSISVSLPVSVSTNSINNAFSSTPHPSVDNINVLPFHSNNNAISNPSSAPAATMSVVENYKQNALEIERHYFITADMIKVATEKSEFVILNKLPKPLHFDTSATYIAYFEQHSPLVYRLDVYKRDNTLCRDEKIEQYASYLSSSNTTSSK